MDHVYHRPGAIWPFTTVGRPPQEDTSFGEFIHEITGPMIPHVVPGIKAVHAVDAAGVHPLFLAIGSERYTPFKSVTEPQEILTQAHALLGQGQLSLAKYLWIINHQDNPQLDIHNIPAFFQHVLERVDWSRDLHFQTCTTIDTLDYSGQKMNRGSKVVVAAAGPKKRQLKTQGPVPGVLIVNEKVNNVNPEHFPLVVIVDDVEFASRTLHNFLWVTFTRSNPASDIDGIEAFTQDKHWGCRGSLVIDARIKSHHAPALEEDPAIQKRIESLAAKGGPLESLI